MAKRLSPSKSTIGGLRYTIDLLRGQKTGFYLDQLPNYAAGRRVCRGRTAGARLLRQSGRVCPRLRTSRRHAGHRDRDQRGMRGTVRNATPRANALPVEAYAANVFDILKDIERQEARYDLIILDPPTFTKSKGKLHDAMRGYKEIHLRALKLLQPEGLLATFCCSHHVTRELFLETINEAAVDAKKTLRQLATYTQALDHPIITTLPETEYLKGYVFELVPGR